MIVTDRRWPPRKRARPHIPGTRKAACSAPPPPQPQFGVRLVQHDPNLQSHPQLGVWLVQHGPHLLGELAVELLELKKWNVVGHAGR